MTRSFYIETFGCRMNELDSEKIAGALCREGLRPARDPGEADVVIVNTCSVREKAAQKAYARLGQLRRRKARERGLIIGVVGCLAQLEGAQLLRRVPGLDLVAGPQREHRLPQLLRQRLAGGAPAVDLGMDEGGAPAETEPVLRRSRFCAGVTISEGCSRRCSFCVVPAARGPQRDRPGAAVVREVERLAQEGYVEVTLLGQTVTSYRDPAGEYGDLAALLRRLCRIDGLERIRFSAPHPGDFGQALVDTIASCPKICEHVHLPVQSGSTRILRAMRRGYTRDTYLRVVERIRAAARPIALSTDIIVGYPGESEKDFEDTLSLLAEVQYDSVFSFKYSPRPNTPAFESADDVPEEIKSRRLSLLQERQRAIQFARNAACVGNTLEVLVEEKARTNFSLAGRAGNNKIVNFDGPDHLMGKIVPVEITGYTPNSLKGVWKRAPREEA